MLRLGLGVGLGGAMMFGGGLLGCGRRRDARGAVASDGAGTAGLDDEEYARLAERRSPIPATAPLVRVRVLRVRGEDGMIRVGQPGRWLRVTQPTRWEVEGGRGTAMRGPVDFAAWSRGWMAIDADGYRAPLSGFEPVRIMPVEAEERGLAGDLGGQGAERSIGVALNETRYPGFLQLTARTDEEPGAFDVVNHVPVESYLPGVVAKELYNHWHLQTHMAQAVAARSFACAEHGYFASRRHFDLTDTQASQVYAGLVRHKRSIEAVEATRGELLAHEGLLVHAYYSSCCGGRAACATDAISANPINDIPPLQGCPEPDVCETAPVYSWENRRGVEETTRRLIAFGVANRMAKLPDLVALTTIEVAAVNRHGRPSEYVVSDRAGLRVHLPSESMRRAINYAGQGLHPPTRPLRSSNFTATIDEDTIVFTGYGFGHGVGMCQHGAEIHAQAGRSYREILEWYYPRADLVRAYT